MKRIPLDLYDEFPREMRSYIRNYGFSFSKRACEYAVKLMKKKNTATEKMEPIDPFSKEQVEEMLTRNGIKLEHNIGHNFVYVANMAKADYWKSCIDDELHLCKYIKDVIDDVDDNPENVFRRWMVSMDGTGEVIPWDEIL